MYTIYYKQINPNTGETIREERMATCESLRMANWIKNSLEEGNTIPNRQYRIESPEKLSLDQIMREYQPFKNDSWELTVIEERENDLIVMAPNGDTQYMSKEQYNAYKIKREKNDRSN